MPSKPKGANAAYTKLKKDIAAGSIGRLYILCGEEAYLRDHYLNQMKKKLVPQGMEAFNLHTFSGKEADARQISQAVDALPMMSERTLVVVNDYDLYKAPGDSRDILAELFSALPDYCCLVFIYDVLEYKPDARMKLAAAVKAHGSVVKFERQQQNDLTDWIARRFHALGHEIDTRDAQYLIFLCGDLMNGLLSEIGKIGAYAKGKRVTREDIDAVAIPQTDAVVFQMTDAIARKDFDRAAAILGDLLRMQETPIMLLAVLGRQLRQIYTARLALEKGKGTGYLMELWGMRSSYPAEKLLDSAKRFSLQWCRRAVRRCAETDLAMKSVTGGDAQQMLISLLLELAEGKARPAGC